MNYQTIAKVLCALLSIYFVVSGLNAAFNIDSKLNRIGLTANSVDGKVAFILIYSSLMVGIGIAMSVLALTLKSPGPSLTLAAVILLCFVIFRIFGSFMTGSLTAVQIGYVITEIVEFSIVLYVLYKIGAFRQRIG